MRAALHFATVIMALYFAQVSSSDRIQRVIVVNDAYAANGAQWCADNYGGQWLETKLNGSVRGTYAGIGYRYDPVANSFIAKTVAQAGVTFLGDSITQQMSGFQAGWTAPLNGASLLGVSGNTAAQIAARVGQVSGSASHVVIQAGTNDLFGLDNSTGIIPAYTAMLNALTPTKRVLVIGIPPVDEAQLLASWGSSGVAVLNNTRIASMNAQISTLCAGYLNCSTVPAAMSMNMSGKTTDGIHFQSSGYTQLVNAIMPLL